MAWNGVSKCDFCGLFFNDRQSFETNSMVLYSTNLVLATWIESKLYEIKLKSAFEFLTLQLKKTIDKSKIGSSFGILDKIPHTDYNFIWRLIERWSILNTNLSYILF